MGTMEAEEKTDVDPNVCIPSLGSRKQGEVGPIQCVKRRIALAVDYISHRHNGQAPNLARSWQHLADLFQSYTARFSAGRSAGQGEAQL